ncbi:MAG: hypothetical protein Q7S22_01855 [Candidatus Micrarchaeota archaeon]|nr:hypothetical protein [Candidatus Micrarchaeota archaeon]
MKNTIFLYLTIAIILVGCTYTISNKESTFEYSGQDITPSFCLKYDNKTTGNFYYSNRGAWFPSTAPADDRHNPYQECMYIAALKQNNESVCMNLDSEFILIRNFENNKTEEIISGIECLKTIAKEKGNASICMEIDHKYSDSIKRCVIDIAIIKKDTGICKILQDEKNYTVKNCFESATLAIGKNECKQMDNISKLECYISVDEKDAELRNLPISKFNNLSVLNWTETCLAAIARDKANASICMEINDVYSISAEYYVVHNAITKKDARICKILQSKERVIWCFGHVTRAIGNNECKQMANISKLECYRSVDKKYKEFQSLRHYELNNLAILN